MSSTVRAPRAATIAIVVSYPGHLARRHAVFLCLLAAERRPIEQVIHRKQHVEAAEIGRIAMKKQVVVPQEYAQARQFAPKIEMPAMRKPSRAARITGPPGDRAAMLVRCRR